MLLQALLSQELLERALVPEGKKSQKPDCAALCGMRGVEMPYQGLPPTVSVPTGGQGQAAPEGMPTLQTDLLKQPGPSEENQLLALIIAYVFVSRARKISTGKYTYHQNAFG